MNALARLSLSLPELRGDEMKSRIRSFVPFLLILLTTLAIRLPSAFLSVIDSDESNFLVIAQGILKGHLPYTYAFEHKPAGLYFIFAGIIWIFGDDPIGVRIGGILIVFLTTSLIWRCTSDGELKISHGQRYLLCACYIVATAGLDGDSVMSELLINLFSACWIYLIRDFSESKKYYKLFLAGVAMGASMQVNYLTAYLLIAFSISTLAWHLSVYESKNAITNYVSFGGVLFSGFAFGNGALLIPIVASGAHQYFGLQLQYLQHYQSTFTFNQSILALLRVSELFLLPLVFLYSALASNAEHNAWLRREWPQNSLYIAVLAGVFFGGAFAAIGSGWMYHHYFLLVILPIILLYAPAMTEVRFTKFGRTISMASLLMFSAFALNVQGARNIVDGMAAASEIMRRRPIRHDPMRQLAMSISPDVQHRVLYAPCSSPIIYALTEATPATIYTYALYYLEPTFQKIMNLNGEVEVQRALNRHPGVVVLEDEAHCEASVSHETFTMIERELGRAGYMRTRRYDYGASQNRYQRGWIYEKTPKKN